LLKRIRVAYHWAMARQDDLDHGPAKALLRLARIEALQPLAYYQRAYMAWLLFHAGRSEDSMRAVLQAAVGGYVVFSGEGFGSHTGHHHAPLVILADRVTVR
jgi:hypothetical protein